MPTCTTHGANSWGDRFAPAPEKLPLSFSPTRRARSVPPGALGMDRPSHRAVLDTAPGGGFQSCLAFCQRQPNQLNRLPRI